MNLIKIISSLLCLALLIGYITLQYYLPMSEDSIQRWNLTKAMKKDNWNAMMSKEKETRFIYVGGTMEAVLPAWGGNCTRRNWEKCRRLRLVEGVWNLSYPIIRKNPKLGYTYHEINCTASEVLCLKNGWTVTRCQLLCMRCNREIQRKYEKFVSKEGPCEMD